MKLLAFVALALPSIALAQVDTSMYPRSPDFSQMLMTGLQARSMMLQNQLLQQQLMQRAPEAAPTPSEFERGFDAGHASAIQAIRDNWGGIELSGFDSLSQSIFAISDPEEIARLKVRIYTATGFSDSAKRALNLMAVDRERELLALQGHRSCRSERGRRGRLSTGLRLTWGERYHRPTQLRG